MNYRHRKMKSALACHLVVASVFSSAVMASGTALSAPKQFNIGSNGSRDLVMEYRARAVQTYSRRGRETVPVYDQFVLRIRDPSGDSQPFYLTGPSKHMLWGQWVSEGNEVLYIDMHGKVMLLKVDGTSAPILGAEHQSVRVSRRNEVGWLAVSPNERFVLFPVDRDDSIATARFDRKTGELDYFPGLDIPAVVDDTGTRIAFFWEHPPHEDMGSLAKKAEEFMDFRMPNDSDKQTIGRAMTKACGKQLYPREIGDEPHEMCFMFAKVCVAHLSIGDARCLDAGIAKSLSKFRPGPFHPRLNGFDFKSLPAPTAYVIKLPVSPGQAFRGQIVELGTMVPQLSPTTGKVVGEKPDFAQRCRVSFSGKEQVMCLTNGPLPESDRPLRFRIESWDDGSEILGDIISVDVVTEIEVVKDSNMLAQLPEPVRIAALGFPARTFGSISQLKDFFPEARCEKVRDGSMGLESCVVPVRGTLLNGVEHVFLNKKHALVRLHIKTDLEIPVLGALHDRMSEPSAPDGQEATFYAAMKKLGEYLGPAESDTKVVEPGFAAKMWDMGDVRVTLVQESTPIKASYLCVKTSDFPKEAKRCLAGQLEPQHWVLAAEKTRQLLYELEEKATPQVRKRIKRNAEKLLVSCAKRGRVPNTMKIARSSRPRVDQFCENTREFGLEGKVDDPVCDVVDYPGRGAIALCWVGFPAIGHSFDQAVFTVGDKKEELLGVRSVPFM